MRNHNLLILLFVAYIFSPTLFTWMTNPEGAWYRPYIIWMALIVTAFVYQLKSHDNGL